MNMATTTADHDYDDMARRAWRDSARLYRYGRKLIAEAEQFEFLAETARLNAAWVETRASEFPPGTADASRENAEAWTRHAVACRKTAPEYKYFGRSAAAVARRYEHLAVIAARDDYGHFPGGW